MPGPPGSRLFPYTTLFRSHLGARETAVAVDASGVLAVFDADSLVARADGAAPSTREAFGPALALPDLAGDTVRLAAFRGDRKSTRLNSSHTVISYAVFCLK